MADICLVKILIIYWSGARKNGITLPVCAVICLVNNEAKINVTCVVQIFRAPFVIDLFLPVLRYIAVTTVKMPQ